MSEEIVFDPDVEVSEQALTRKRKFLETKKQGRFEVVPTKVRDLLPQLWFDDSGEIVSMTYDLDFTPDATWKTYDFNEKSIKEVVAKGTNYYKVEREVNGDDVNYSIVLKKDQTSRVVHNSNLRYASKNYDSKKVSILVDIQKDSIILSVTDVGRDAMKDLGTQNFYITELRNPHFMLQHFTFDPADLVQNDITYELKEDYRLKSVYFDGPFVYGRL